jgi:hypothetical protein
VTTPDQRDVDLLDRAERYGDELDRNRLRTAVAVLLSVVVALAIALVVAAVHATATPFAPNPDNRPAFPAGTAAPMPAGQAHLTPVPLRPDTRMWIPKTLAVHGHSAPREDGR